jgi:hypothetical protein
VINKRARARTISFQSHHCRSSITLCFVSIAPLSIIYHTLLQSHHCRSSITLCFNRTTVDHLSHSASRARAHTHTHTHTHTQYPAPSRDRDTAERVSELVVLTGHGSGVCDLGWSASSDRYVDVRLFFVRVFCVSQKGGACVYLLKTFLPFCSAGSARRRWIQGISHGLPSFD